jgi:hypothetical protein
LGRAHQPFVWRQEHCYASVNLADRQGDEHCVWRARTPIEVRGNQRVRARLS